MDEKREYTKWSPGNQFCFPGDGFAYSIAQNLQTFRVPESEVVPCLDGSKRHGNPVIDNLITLDINERNRVDQSRKRRN